MAGLCAVALLVAAGGRARAAPPDGCGDQPAQLLFSYPAKGQENVPTNAVLVLLPTWGTPVSVTLNGAAVAPRGSAGIDAFVYETGALAPGSAHEALVLLGEGPTVKKVKVAFTTGSHVADPPAAPVVAGSAPAQGAQDGACGLVLDAQQCDVAAAEAVRLDVGATVGAVAGTVVYGPGGRSTLWPAACIPEAFVDADRASADLSAVCFDVRTLGADGTLSDAGAVCPYEASPGSPADSGSGAGGGGGGAASGCGAGSNRRGTAAGPIAVLLACGLLLAVRRAGP